MKDHWGSMRKKLAGKFLEVWALVFDIQKKAVEEYGKVYPILEGRQNEQTGNNKDASLERRGRISLYPWYTENYKSKQMLAMWGSSSN